MAVNYDLGVNGSAYFDMDTANYRISTGKESTGNRGHTYRNDGVDIFKDSLNEGDFYVGDIESGEWLQYTMDIKSPGTYKLLFQVAALQPVGSFSITLNESRFPDDQIIAIPATGGNQDWKFVASGNITLNAGLQRLRIHAVHGGFNLKSIWFMKP
jgi:endoglucanase